MFCFNPKTQLTTIFPPKNTQEELPSCYRYCPTALRTRFRALCKMEQNTKELQPSLVRTFHHRWTVRLACRRMQREPPDHTHTRHQLPILPPNKTKNKHTQTTNTGHPGQGFRGARFDQGGGPGAERRGRPRQHPPALRGARLGLCVFMYMYMCLCTHNEPDDGDSNNRRAMTQHTNHHPTPPLTTTK